MRGRDTSIGERTVRFLSDPCWSSDEASGSAGGKRRHDVVGEATIVSGGADGLGCGADNGPWAAHVIEFETATWPLTRPEAPHRK